jgi:ABC-type Fe3+-hydroxamate transport system substrate-binding protein
VGPTPADALVDAAGRRHQAYSGKPRIVSLVPSITELVCALGLAGELVGRTGFCIHPRDALRHVPKLGGTKTVDLDKLQSLEPTHVVLNIDENPREMAEAITAFGAEIIVTHPLAPIDNIALYRMLGGIFRRETEAERLAESYLERYNKISSTFRDARRIKTLYLIWKNPWMTVSHDTYISRTLALAGFDTVPAEATERYPKIDIEHAAREADLVLLSSEPYSFREKDLAALREYPAVAGKYAALIDGEMTSWYGPRAIAGLDYLAALRSRLDEELLS